GTLLPSEVMPDIRFPSVIIVTGEWTLVRYDLFAISRVLPTVPKIRLSCIFCTWFPLRRSEVRGHSIRPACACRTQTGGLLSILF
ncbi:MAG: hypothetical protein U9R02_16200, partial [Thermodesulfobacteriota bacterium]|nr:hypothetical protein [Thermodesulfobacteriota bacterium]